MPEPFNFLGSLSDKEVSEKEGKYYDSHKDLKLTETQYTTQYGRKVYEDQHGRKHSESSRTIQDSKGRWMNIPSIYNGEYVNDRLAKEIIEGNEYIDPETNQKIKTYETQKDAETEAIKRDRTLNESDQSWNEEENMMNQRQAGNVLKRFAPKGEHPAFINDDEASWLKGMGGLGKKTKSGLRSYTQDAERATDNANQGEAVSDDYSYGGGEGIGDGNYSWQGVKNSLGSASQTLGADGKMYWNNSPDSPTGQIAEAGANASGQIAGAVGNLTTGGMETRNNQSTSVSELDRPTHEFRQEIYDGASDVMDKDYESYSDATGGAERFADASADTLTAQTGVRDLQGRGQGVDGAYAQAGAVGQDVSGYSAEQVQGGNFLAGQGVDQYMNPHTSNVINANTNQAMKAMQMGRNQLGAQAQMAGAGMGSRSAIEKGVMASGVLGKLNTQNYNALNQSYTDASAQKRQDMQMNQNAQQANQQAGLSAQGVRLQGANAQVSAMDAGRGAGYQDAQALSQVGADIEGRDQNDKDFAYDEYTEERDWDRNNVSFGSNVLSGAPIGTTTTQNNPQYRNQKVDRFGRIIAGAGSGWLATGGNPYGAVVGGVVGGMS